MRRILGCAAGTLLIIAIPATAAQAHPGHAGFGQAGLSHSRLADHGRGPGGFGGPGGVGHGPNPGHHYGHRHHHPQPYTGGAPTHTGAVASPGVVGKPETISVEVSSEPGFEQPTGTVDVTVTGPGGYSWSGTATVTGSWVTLTADPPTTQGYYAVAVNYSPGDAGFKSSGSYTGFFAYDPSTASGPSGSAGSSSAPRLHPTF